MIHIDIPRAAARRNSPLMIKFNIDSIQDMDALRWINVCTRGASYVRSALIE